MTTAYLDFNHVYVKQCNPIYIPHEEHFVKLVILKAHNHVYHSGFESTVTSYEQNIGL